MKDFPRIQTAKDAVAAYEQGSKAIRFLNTQVFRAVADACVAGQALTRVAMPGVSEPAPGQSTRMTNRDLIEALLPSWTARVIQRLVELGYFVEGRVIRASTSQDPAILYTMSISFAASKAVDESGIPPSILLPTAEQAASAAGGSARELNKVLRWVNFMAPADQPGGEYVLKGGEVLLRDNLTDLLSQLGFEVAHPKDQPYGTLHVQWVAASRQTQRDGGAEAAPSASRPVPLVAVA